MKQIYNNSSGNGGDKSSIGGHIGDPTKNLRHIQCAEYYNKTEDMSNYEKNQFTKNLDEKVLEKKVFCQFDGFSEKVSYSPPLAILGHFFLEIFISGVYVGR